MRGVSHSRLQYAVEQEGRTVVELLLRALGGQLSALMTDPFGNYLIQKLVELGSDEQRRVMVRDGVRGEV